MAVYSVSCDLISPQQTYSRLFNAIREYDFIQVQQLHWIIESDESATEIRDSLAGQVELGDSLLVARLSNDAAWLGQTDRVERLLADVFQRA